MTATPWVRATTVARAAEELHVGLSDVAEWVVSGRLRARVQPGAKRPNVWTVEVCAADVSKWRRTGAVQPRAVLDPMFDEFHAQDILRKRRSRTGWPPPWPGMPSGTKAGKPSRKLSALRMGVTDADRVREVRAMVSKLGGRNEWVRFAVVFRKLNKREWAETSDVVRDIVDALIDEGVFEERLFRPRVGRPSPEIRFKKGISDEKA